MKKILLIAFISLQSCNLYNYNYTYTKNEKPQVTIFHKYEAISSVNQNSGFNILNRKIEFEYLKNKVDSLVEIKIMLTTSFIEGELMNEGEIVLTNDEKLTLNLKELASREYVENYAYTTQNPVSTTETISRPATTEVVVKADGTHEVVTKPGTIDNVTVTRNVPEHYSTSKSQIFNQAKVILTKKEFNTIKQIKLKHFNLSTKSAQLKIIPDAPQAKELNNYFFIVL
jgi:hypothetical protein